MIAGRDSRRSRVRRRAAGVAESRLGARIEMAAPFRKDRDRLEWVSFSDRGVRAA